MFSVKLKYKISSLHAQNAQPLSFSLFPTLAYFHALHVPLLGARINPKVDRGVSLNHSTQNKKKKGRGTKVHFAGFNSPQGVATEG